MFFYYCALLLLLSNTVEQNERFFRAGGRMGWEGKRAIASGYRIFYAATRGSACAMGECVRYGLTRIMPIYCLEFDLFEKSVWFGGKIEYCAICPYMARVSGSSPNHPKNVLWVIGPKCS